MSVESNPNWKRGLLMLERQINTANDLIEIWRMYGSYNFGAPAIESRPHWFYV